ncbi:MAG: 4-alpha-glucanotransferase, partial [Candidatus Omnitrophica bacterium]|nr:4-alpha-glucanotransferase [Candidatus Omnitrophota bacterium]
RRQLRSLIEHARKRGVEFAIDRPVSLEGSDVWLNPDVFGLSSKNGYKRLTTRGLPPEPGQWAGQYWQFFPFDWSNPKTAQFVLKMSKFYHQLGFSYERKDHTLGYYRTFHCVEDIDNQLELNKLKVTPEDDKTLFERVIEVRERVLALSEAREEEKKTKEEAKDKAAKEVIGLFKKTFLEMRKRDEHIAMPADALQIAFDEKGELYPDNAIRICRKVPEEKRGEVLPETTAWLRQEVVEKEVFKRESEFDFLLATPSEMWGHPGFMRQYLFPESYPEKDVLAPPQPEDRLLLGYYKLNPADKIMANFLEFAQKNGTQEIWETLGSVPEQISNSTKRLLGGTDIAPLIWGLLPEEDFHPSKISPNCFVTGSVSDWSTLSTHWEEELDDEQKTKLLAEWLPSLKDKEAHFKHFTPEVHRAILKHIYSSPGRMVVPFWLDILALNDNYRINHPGVQSKQWERRLPLDATIEAFLAAAQGKDKKTTEMAKKAIETLRYCQSLRPKPSFDGKTTEILSVDPTVGSTILQIRELGKPFLVDTYIHGKAAKVKLVVNIKGKEIKLPMYESIVKAGLPKTVSKWTSNSWAADKEGIYEFYIEAKARDGKLLKTEKGKLFAVSQTVDLNPLAQKYIGYKYGLGNPPQRAQPTSKYADSSFKAQAASPSSISDISKVKLPQKGSLPVKNLLVIGGLANAIDQLYLKVFKDLAENYNIKLHAVDRVPEQKARKIISQRKLPYQTYSQKLPSEKIDGVLVITWPKSHLEFIDWAVRRNIPVFVEKPVVLPRQIKQLEFLYQQKVPIFIIDHFFDNPVVNDAAKFISQGKLGDLTAVEGILVGNWAVESNRAWLLKPRLSGGGISMDLGAHLIAGIEQLLESQDLSFKDFRLDRNSVFMARYNGAPKGAETYAYIKGKIKGIPVELKAGNGTTREISAIVVRGTKGTLTFNPGVATKPFFKFNPVAGRVQHKDYPIFSHTFGNVVYRPIVRKIFDSLQGLGNVSQEERDFRLKATTLSVKVIARARKAFGSDYYSYPFGRDPDHQGKALKVANSSSAGAFETFAQLKAQPENQQLVNAFWQQVERQGVPLIAENRRDVVFIYREGEGYQGKIDSVALASDISGWWQDKNEPLRKLGETDLWHLTRSLKPSARLEYKFVINGKDLILDPRNSHRSATKDKSWVYDNSLLTMPEFKPDPALTKKPKQRGTIEEFKINSNRLGYSHAVKIYLPFKYNDRKNQTRRYPTVYFQDGEDYLNLKLTDAGRILDNLIEAGQIEPLIGVFVIPPEEQGRNRKTEYLERKNDYAQFFTSELVPAVDQKYRSFRNAGQRLISGYCYGGLISLYIALNRPDVFAQVASQSGYLFLRLKDIFSEFRPASRVSKDPTAVSIYLSEGRYSRYVKINGHQEKFDFVRANRRFRNDLGVNQYRQVKFRQLASGHSWESWRNDLPDILRHFFGRSNRETDKTSSSQIQDERIIRNIRKMVSFAENRGAVKFLYSSKDEQFRVIRRFFWQTTPVESTPYAFVGIVQALKKYQVNLYAVDREKVRFPEGTWLVDGQTINIYIGSNQRLSEVVRNLVAALTATAGLPTSRSTNKEVARHFIYWFKKSAVWRWQAWRDFEHVGDFKKYSSASEKELLGKSSGEVDYGFDPAQFFVEASSSTVNKELSVVDFSQRNLPEQKAFNPKRLLVIGGLADVVSRFYKKNLEVLAGHYNIKLQALDRLSEPEAWIRIKERNLPYESYTTILPEDKPDAVLVLTWPDSHLEFVRWAVEHKIPVFVEKPIVLPEQLKEIKSLAELGSSIYALDYGFDNPAVLEAARFISQGGLGKLLEVRGSLMSAGEIVPGRQWHLDRRINGGGSGMDIMVHLIAAIDTAIEGQGLSFNNFTLD